MAITTVPVYQFHPTVPAGEVISQSPAPGLVGPDTLVTLYISQGPGGWFASQVNTTEAAKTHYAMFVAVDFDFPSGHARVWSGWGTIVIGGNSFLGVGTLGRVSSTPERVNLTFERKTYQLAGAEVNPMLVSEADLDGSFGRSVIEYFGFLNSETHQLLDVPEVNFEGEISNIRRVDGTNPMIEVNAENRMIVLDQNDGWRYTHQHQAQFYTGDLGFDQVPKIESSTVRWGGRPVVVGTLRADKGGPDDGRPLT